MYAHTHSPAVLLAIVFVHVEALQQLLPLGRLDGYFVVADLVGVPDLFGRIGPILRSAVPGRPTDPKVAELRRSARVVVTLWVVLTGPIMVGILAFMLWNAALDHRSGGRRDEPRMDATAGVARRPRRSPVSLLARCPSSCCRCRCSGSPGWSAASCASRGRQPLRRSRTRPPTVSTPYRPQPEEIPMSGSDPATAVRRRPPGPAPGRRTSSPSASCCGPSRIRPGRGWRRGVFAVTGGQVNPGPEQGRAPRGRAARPGPYPDRRVAPRSSSCPARAAPARPRRR